MRYSSKTVVMMVGMLVSTSGFISRHSCRVFGTLPRIPSQHVTMMSGIEAKATETRSLAFVATCNGLQNGLCQHSRHALNGGWRSNLSSRHSFMTLSSSQNNDTNDDAPAFEPTWTYVPYKPPPPKSKKGRRRYNTKNDGEWKVPNKITIPEDKIEMSFTRSSGAGGQNVNKVNTQVNLRFSLMDASWIPHEVRDRIRENESNRLNKQGEIVITSQEYRTQAQNRKDALEKLEELILKHYPRPKVRKMRKGVSKRSKELKKEFKKRRSDVKKNRGRVEF